MCAVRDAMHEMGWSDDVIDGYFSQLDDAVKTGRMLRADRATTAMDKATYRAFCTARGSSFVLNAVPRQMRANDQACKPWLSEMAPSAHFAPLVRQDLAYLAAETVFTVVDLVLLLRADARDGTCLRYEVLRRRRGEGEDDNDNVSGLRRVWQCLGADDFASVISADEIRNVSRLFCSNFGGDSALDKSVLLCL